MNNKNTPNHISLNHAKESLADHDGLFKILFENQDVTVELYQPLKVDLQKPHDRDEIYIIAEGEGSFLLNEDRFQFSKGDFFFVPKGAPHRFIDFSDDFATWVIFIGE